MIDPAACKLLGGMFPRGTENDVIHAARGGFGAVWCADADTAQDMNKAAAKITAFTDTLDDGYWCTASGDQITCRQGGIYLVCMYASFSGSVSNELHLHVRADAVATPIGIHRVIGSGGDVGSGCALLPLSLSAGAVLTMYGNSAADSKTITIVDGGLWALRVGPA